MIEVTYTLTNGYEGCEEVHKITFPYYDAEQVMDQGVKLYTEYMHQWIHDPYYIDFPEPNEFDTTEEYSKEYDKAWNQWLEEGNWDFTVK